MAIDFVKQNDLEFAAQLQQMKENLPTYLAILGLNLSEQTLANDMADAMIWIVSRNNAAPGFVQDWSKLRDQVRLGIGGDTLQPMPVPPDVSMPPATIPVNIEKKYRALVKRIKSADAYTSGIGENLGIVAPKTIPDYSKYKPVFKLKLTAGQVLILWKKLQAQGVNIYKKIDSGTWYKLDFDGTPNYLDTSATPPAGSSQIWSYKLRYVKGDIEIGEPSLIVSINVSGA
jgi:hypothetical protein